MFVFLCLPLVDAMYVAACQSVVCLVADSLTVGSMVCTYSMSRNLRCILTCPSYQSSLPVLYYAIIPSQRCTYVVTVNPTYLLHLSRVVYFSS